MMKKTPIKLSLAALSVALLLGGCASTPDQSPHAPIAPPTAPFQWHPLMEKPTDGNAYVRVYQDTSEVGNISITSRDMALIRAIRAVYPDAPIHAGSGVDLSRPIDVWVDKLTPAQYLSYLGTRIGGRVEITAEGAIQITAHDRAVVDFGAAQMTRNDWTQLVDQASRIADRHDDLWIIADHENKVFLLSGNGQKLDGARAALEQFRTYHLTRNATR
ncbi:MAG: hypothetical protein IBX50_16870 [Marinospirillum sp.]|uniref:hypothetical protein n=1 Tax=Marinospirillum sp. TaxID=2183934 RepID=UPI0019DB2FE9|nr:hypothetical protein [Marinospirillum sp.]MBE0508363.1 hypothetical protein [Marinospirillum sp.]